MSAAPAPDPDRIALAESFLREAVHRSRTSSSALAALGRPGAAGCGLGERARVDLDLTEAARGILPVLFPDPLPSEAVETVRAASADWVERQDALDRKRNHFLKAFRTRHGFDRTAYAPELLAEYEAGLAAIADEEDGERRAAAERLLAAGGRSG